MRIEIRKLSDGAVWTELFYSDGRWKAAEAGRHSLKYMIKKFCN